jgi:hypothetical protein
VDSLWIFLRRYPASLYVSGLGAVLALIESFGALSAQQAGWVTAIVLGIGTAASVFLARPPHLALLSGAAAEIISGLALFNVHLSPAQEGHFQGLVTVLVTFITGMVAMHPNLTPRLASFPPAPQQSAPAHSRARG